MLTTLQSCLIHTQNTVILYDSAGTFGSSCICCGAHIWRQLEATSRTVRILRGRWLIQVNGVQSAVWRWLVQLHKLLRHLQKRLFYTYSSKMGRKNYLVNYKEWPIAYSTATRQKRKKKIIKVSITEDQMLPLNQLFKRKKKKTFCGPILVQLSPKQLKRLWKLYQLFLIYRFLWGYKKSASPIVSRFRLIMPEDLSNFHECQYI